MHCTIWPKIKPKTNQQLQQVLPWHGAPQLDQFVFALRYDESHTQNVIELRFSWLRAQCYTIELSRYCRHGVNSWARVVIPGQWGGAPEWDRDGAMHTFPFNIFPSLLSVLLGPEVTSLLLLLLLLLDGSPPIVVWLRDQGTNWLRYSVVADSLLPTACGATWGLLLYTIYNSSHAMWAHHNYQKLTIYYLL